MSDAKFPALVRILPLRKPASGTLAVPGGKSVGNRAILLAACAGGRSVLRGLLASDDTDAALRTLSALGVRTRLVGGALHIDGAGLDFPVRAGEIRIGSSGTVGRFLPGLLAASTDGDWTLVSTPQLAGRPLTPLVGALKGWNARLEFVEPGKSFPLRVRGGGLSGGETPVSARASSQFASGLLLAAPLCRKPATVRIDDLDPEETYIDITLDLMGRFGVGAKRSWKDGALLVDFEPRRYAPADITIEADANTAGYFFALAAVTGGRVGVANLDAASRQPGIKFLDVLTRLGCAVDPSDGVVVSGPPHPLRGGFSIDMRAMSEMALTLGVLAVFADKPIAMTNLRHIRGHESDRIAALAAILRSLGAKTDETENGIAVHPLRRENIANVVIDPLDDHRVAMSFAVLGAAANGIAIQNPGCVKKTCPDFFTMLRRTGAALAP